MFNDDVAPPTPSHLPLATDHPIRPVSSPTANEDRESDGESGESVNDEDDQDGDERREADSYSQHAEEEDKEDSICPDGHHATDTETEGHHAIDTEILISQCYHLPLISSSLW